MREVIQETTLRDPDRADSEVGQLADNRLDEDNRIQINRLTIETQIATTS